MTRRTDSSLRSAISVIEKLLLTDPSTEAILTRSLCQLMELLGASFGYVYQCKDMQGHKLPWEFVCSYELPAGSEPEEIENSSASSRVPDHLRKKLLSGRSILPLDISETGNTFPHIRPSIENICTIPILDTKRLYGAIFLCGVPFSIDKDLESRLRPFIAASGCLLRSAEKKRKFQHTVAGNELSGRLQLLSGLLDTMFNTVIVVDEDDYITLCNDSASSLLSISKTDIIGQHVERFLPKGSPQINSRLTTSSDDVLQVPSKRVWRGVPIIKPNGEKILVDLSGFELNDGERTVRGLVIDDISERIRSSADYHQTLQRFQALTNLVPVGILQLNREWECTYSNDTWCEYCQMTPDEAKGIGWLKGLHLTDADTVLSRLRQETGVKGKYEGEFRLHSPLGKVTWVKANACVLYNENSEVSGLIITFNDITQHRSSEQRLKEIAEKDQLTGLVNRAFFNDRVEVALQGIPRNGPIALMFIDLDEFKDVNDTLGHEAGDQLLRDVARRLNDTLRLNDTVARIGGDEFTVMLPNISDPQAVMMIAEKLLAALAEPFMLDQRLMYITCSIGITIAESDSMNTTQLLKQADAALYKAKKAGRNQYKFYTAELNTEAKLHIHLRQSLKEKARGDFYVVYQTQVDASTDEIIGVEALTRWRHPDIKNIGPDVFIKLIEDSGMIEEFSSWLFDDVFRTMDQWRKRGLLFSNFKVSINLSAKQFRDSDLAFYIHKKCRSYGIEPSWVVLELTETAIVEDPEIAVNTLRKLNQMGFRIALDDFGTGYSSLMHLRNMPLQIVKIDQSFVKDVVHDNEDAKIVQAILALASTLNLDVVAEGVENKDVKEWLLSHACSIQQGYLFQKPLDLDAIESLLIKRPPHNVNVLPFNEIVR